MTAEAAPRRADARTDETWPLLLALTRGSTRRPDPGQLADLVARTSSERLLAEMERHRMTVLLGARLTEAVGDALPGPLRERLAASRQSARRLGAAQETMTLHLAGTLEGAGIPCVPLKGQTLARRLYGEPGMRATGDVDLLVPSDRLWDAAAVLRGQGLSRPLPCALDARGLPLLHLILESESARGRLPPVELHWRIHWYERDLAGGMLERSHPDTAYARRLTPADELASLLTFYARDGFVGLRLAADIAAHVDLQPDALRDVPALAAAHPALGPTLIAATAVTDALVLGGAHQPPGFAERPGRREALAIRLANWSGRGSSDQIAANVALVDALLAPAGGMADFWDRQMRENRGLAATYAHAAKSLGRFALAGWQVRGGRCLAPLPEPVVSG